MATEDTVAVSRLKAASAVILGKTSSMLFLTLGEVRRLKKIGEFSGGRDAVQRAAARINGQAGAPGTAARAGV
ncbi:MULTISPECIES: hypothetical protein [Streptomyces]|uniref:hypothetical protein n=1 Tax=Streptomyces TaxID=1883 RepID=UPI00211F0765|nr:hypothetical protein [Streptomyces sp. HG99]